jgi:hypothetical protein
MTDRARWFLIGSLFLAAVAGMIAGAIVFAMGG